jgi:serine/threonine-protein kinase RsbW
LAGQSAPAITASLLQKVRAFAGGARQSDDIAILTLKVNVSGHINLELHATPEDVMRGVEALQEFAAAQQVPEGDVFGLALALEECGSNIAEHALKRDAQRTFQVAIERSRDAFVIELRDDGPEFDPTAAAPLKPQAEDNDLPGGWGIDLVRRNMDEIRYRREGGKNVLRLTKRLISACGGE